MAYADAHNEARKLTAGVAVIALEAGLAWSIIVAMTFTATHKARDRIQGYAVHQVPIKPPPPPAPSPKQPVVQPPHLAPAPPISTTLADPGPTIIGDMGKDSGGTDVGTVAFPKVEPVPVPVPTPKPLFAPKNAKPRGNSATWLSTDDYPRRGLLDLHEGRVGYRLTIDPGGRVTDCSIASSSGFAELDQATCQLLPRRAKFEAARDESGNPTVGYYSGSVTWRLPPEE